MMWRPYSLSMMKVKLAKYSLGALAATGLILASGCPEKPIISPTPTPSPFVSPTPTPQSTTDPLGPLAVVELANGNLVSDSFKLEFGPGSKGIKLEVVDPNEFGPGSKGPRTEFGPGTKGPKNLEFNVQLPQGLTSSSLPGFSVQQLAVGGGLFLNQLQVEFIRDNQLYATASILPRRPELNVEARFHPGEYSIKVIAQTVKGPLTMSWSQVEVLRDFDTALKVEVFANPDGVAKPEDLDVEILTQNRQAPDDPPEASPSPAATETPVPTDTPDPYPTGGDNLTPPIVSTSSPSSGTP